MLIKSIGILLGFLNMIQKKVDIIIPVYNKEFFLYDLIESLCRLPENLFNIIFVDDGSIDNSFNIIEQKVLENSLQNFYCYKKINGGVSSARNYGLSLSVSEYIWFFDPDDSVHEDFFENVKCIENIKEDIIIFNYSIKDLRNNKIKNQKFNKYGLINKIDFMTDYDALLSETKDMNYVWNKLYKREFLKDVNFDENLHLGEDRKFNLQLFSQGGRAVILDIFLYRYYIYEDGTLSKNLNMKKIENIYSVNIFNINKMKYSRDICKAHIIDQLKIRTMAQCGGVYNFYKCEHKNFNMKIYPFYSFSELILIIMILMHINGFFYKTLSFFKSVKFMIRKKYFS